MSHLLSPSTNVNANSVKGAAGAEVTSATGMAGAHSVVNTRLADANKNLEDIEAMGTMEAVFNLRKASINLLKATSQA
ncbi:hypothetical protein [Variovorax sp. 770b2]|uniref:hypothetical protein n=1 Tax=Variovorax sp. 770b2 TaxID=1566271 RepID=UPI0008E90391|nr:hypothetical protein [Variovorax sp. 770b2]SFQ04376.1 hypothetical protein SAMN03159339_5279 [Variovorax sp. 770b2]